MNGRKKKKALVSQVGHMYIWQRRVFFIRGLDIRTLFYRTLHKVDGPLPSCQGSQGSQRGNLLDLAFREGSGRFLNALVAKVFFKHCEMFGCSECLAPNDRFQSVA